MFESIPSTDHCATMLGPRAWDAAVVAAAPAAARGLLGFSFLQRGTTLEKKRYWNGDDGTRSLMRPVLKAIPSDVEDGVMTNSSSSKLPLMELPRSSLMVRDDATDCDIYLVGCLHGSPSSGRDVQLVMDRVRPGAVVLELCEARHRSLRKDLEKWARGDEPLKGRESWQAAIDSWWKGMRKTAKTSGLLQAILAGSLSAPFLLQRFSNFDPGLEFKTAMAYADGFSLLDLSDGCAERALERKRASSGAGGAKGLGCAGVNDCVVVLGDRDVQETLRRLGGALTGLTRPARDEKEEWDGSGAHSPSHPWGSGEGGQGDQGVVRVEGRENHASVGARGSEQATSTPATATHDRWTIVSDARVLQMALYGPSDREWPDSLQVFETVWRERQVLGSILLPLMVIFYAIVEVSSRSIEGATAAASAMSGGKEVNSFGACAFVGLGLAKLWEAAGDIWDTAFVFGAVWYMLRFFRLVIKERDDVLAASILKTCRDHPGRPVVAVLGLLHCNGVADTIRNSASSQQELVRVGVADEEAS